MVRKLNQRFWCIRRVAKDRDSDYATQINDNLCEQIWCPVDEYHVHPGRRVADLSLTLPTSRPKDFLWTWGSELLCTEEVARMLREAKVTGFETRPATVKSTARKKTILPTYVEIVILGWGGMAAPESGLELLSSCSHCHIRRYRISNPAHLINEAAWDGSDWFMIWPMPAFHFVTDRVAELLRSHGFTGIDLVPADQVFTEPTKFGPGRLQYHMPEDRARQIGEPLGIY